LKLHTCQDSSQRNSRWALLTAVILLGFGLRLVNLNGPALRGDETFTVMHWMREPLAQSIDALKTVDPQPPLAYAIFHAYGRIVGTAPETVRYLPTLVNLLGIPAVFALGRRVAGFWPALGAMLLYAVSPAIIWHAQDARNYALWSAASVIALWLSLLALERGRRADWLLAIASTIIACYLYYLQLLFVAALNLYVVFVYWRRWPVFMRWLISQGIVGLALVIWFTQPALLSGGGYGGTAGRTDPIQVLTVFIPTLLLGTSLTDSLMLAAALISGFLVLSGLWSLRQRPSARPLLLIALIVLPFAGLSLISLRLNVFVPRYVLAASPPLMIALAAGAAAAWRDRNPLAMGVRALSVGFVTILLVSMWNHYLNPAFTKSPDWRLLADYLGDRVTETDAIVNQSADIALTFYLNERNVPGGRFYLPANPAQPAEEIRAVIADTFAFSQHVWLVTRPPQGWANADVPAAAFSEQGLLMQSAEVAGQPVSEFVAADVSDQRVPAQARFGDVVELIDAAFDAPLPGDTTLPVVLTWRPIASSESDLKAFVHLVSATGTDALGPPLAQDDRFPRGGRLSSTSWEPDRPFRDVYSLNLSGVPAGTYRLFVGWYDPATGQRLRVNDADLFTLGGVVVS